MVTVRPPPPNLSDDPVGFVLAAARHDLLIKQKRSAQQMIIACLAGQMYGDALVLAFLLADDIAAARRAELEMFHEDHRPTA